VPFECATYVGVDRRECAEVGTGFQVGLIVVLLGINAVLAGSEVALISLREPQLVRMAARGARGRAVAQLARDPNRFLATIQIGITLSGFLASATAAVSLAEPLIPILGALGAAAGPVAVLLITAVLTFVTLVVGELAPKRIAMQRAEAWAFAAGGALLLVARLTGPFVRLLGVATDLVVRLAGADPSRGRDALTQEEVRDLIATGGLYDPDERRIITGALEAADRILREVLVPRTSVVALSSALPVEEALRRLVASGHSRAPVYTDAVDDADRLVGVMDLVGREGIVGDHARSTVALPESLGVIEALRRMQAARRSLALVVDEYGGVSGIVSIEDLLEELVGEIHDEYDRDVRDAIRHPDGSCTVRGMFPLHDLEDLGIDLDVESVEAVTVAGLVHELLGHLPKIGDAVSVGGWTYTVDAVARRATERVTIGRSSPLIPRGTPPAVELVDDAPSRVVGTPEPPAEEHHS
jgi:putative hemolysin